MVVLPGLVLGWCCWLWAPEPRLARKTPGWTVTASSPTSLCRWRSSPSPPLRLRARARTDFVESVFTTPVTRRDWFVAKVLVLFTLAAVYYLALVPMTFGARRTRRGASALEEIPALDTGSTIGAISVGVLIGVLFIGRSIAAPIWRPG